jgi:hypothetical protein
MRISIVKEAFNRKISILTSKLNIELRKKFDWYYLWNIALYASDNWTLRKLEWKYVEELQDVVLEKNGEDKMVRKSN